MEWSLSVKAHNAIRGMSPNQTLFFVMTSRKRTAHVYNAHIAKHLADSEAREIGGCVRVGHVERRPEAGAVAVTV